MSIFGWNLSVNNPRFENTTNFIATPNIFYSQYNQDRSIESCIFRGFKNGVFMDVGAHDGVDLNNTLYFEVNHNWTGINIEPNINVYNRLLTNRRNCININCAVSNIDGMSEFVLNEGYTEMLSGLYSELDPRHKNRIQDEIIRKGGKTNIIPIETMRIESICDQYKIGHINYLTIDVEGGEMKVLESINFNKVFIDIIGFENNYKDLEHIPLDFLIAKGYKRLPDHTADIFMIHNNSKFNIL